MWQRRPAARRQGKVEWKTDEGVLQKPEPLPFLPGEADYAMTQEVVDFWSFHTVPKGALFLALAPLEVMPDHWEKTNRLGPPFPYLRQGVDQKWVPGWSPEKAYVVQGGGMLTYLGEVRVEEGRDKSSVIRVLRRKFLIGMTPYILPNLGMVRCVASAKFDPDRI